MSVEANRGMGPVAYDLSRLFLAPLGRTPRGIDRIDMMLARHFFSTAANETVGVLPTPWGVRIFRREMVLSGLMCLERLWGENKSFDGDEAYRWVRNRVLGVDPGAMAAEHRISRRDQAARMLSLIATTGFSFGHSAARRIPEDAAYVNIGQMNLAVEWFFRWLRRRPDIRPIFMLHDVIPVEMPHLVSPSSARHHAQMVRTAARYADGIIVSTDYARKTVTGALAREGWHDPTILAAHLPLIEAFDSVSEPDPMVAGRNYFVACGAIEPRKNLLLLLRIWQRLVASMGDDTPHLVVAGSPTAMGHGILSEILSSPTTQGHIHVVSGLSTAGLKTLMAGANALVMPSFAEGYGLPICEALAIGCPVIASDIAAHREVALNGSVLLDPDDDDAWFSVLSGHLREECTYPPVGNIRDQRKDYLERIAKFSSSCPPRGKDFSPSPR